jgi:hypothetical protein
MKFNGGTITRSLAHTSLTIFMWSLLSNFDSKGRPEVRLKEAYSSWQIKVGHLRPKMQRIEKADLRIIILMTDSLF